MFSIIAYFFHFLARLGAKEFFCCPSGMQIVSERIVLFCFVFFLLLFFCCCFDARSEAKYINEFFCRDSILSHQVSEFDLDY